jgi:hypothetical protein
VGARDARLSTLKLEEGTGDSSAATHPCSVAYNGCVERKIFWIVFVVLGLLADFVLPIWWALVATIPIAFVSWWVAYRSEWF